MAGLVPAIHVFLFPGSKNVNARDRPGHDEADEIGVRKLVAYAIVISGKTASILVFSVAALNGLTM